MSTMIRTDVSIGLLQEFKTLLGITTVCDADTGIYQLDFKSKNTEMILLDCISNSWGLIAIFDGDNNNIFLTHASAETTEFYSRLLA